MSNESTEQPKQEKPPNVKTSGIFIRDDETPPVISPSDKTKQPTATPDEQEEIPIDSQRNESKKRTPIQKLLHIIPFLRR